MSLLERGLTWVSLFISLAPIFGFFGTVVGIFMVFEEIEVAGDIAVSVVAGGMKVKLITTIGGLIVAIILQIFYNYIVSKIDNIVYDMEEGAIDFVDMMLKSGYYNDKKI
jgi:biopolymer transport protein ExbB